MTTDIDTTVGEWVVQHPRLARVFESLGMDYCCGGRATLAQACHARGLDAATVAALLLAAEAAPPADAAPVDVSRMTLSGLTDHIEQTHHAFLKRELPRLQPLIEKLARDHGDDGGNLVQLGRVFSRFRAEMEEHMKQEETVLFPRIRDLGTGSGADRSRCGDLGGVIEAMHAEHQDAGDALATMRRLTHDYAAPPGSCLTYGEVMCALAEIEADMHRHVHKENNALFPRAADVERRRLIERTDGQ